MRNLRGQFNKREERREAIVNGLTSGVKEIWDNSWVKKKLYDPIVGWWKKNTPELKVKNKIETTKNTVSKWWSNIKKWWGDKKLSISSSYKTTKSTVSNWWSSVKKWWGTKKLSISSTISTTRSTVSNWWSNIKSWWGNKKLSLSVEIGKVTGNIKQWFNDKLIRPLNNKLPGFIPKIPYLAQGGWLKANNPQLAIVGDNKHEPEIVAPESKIKDQVVKGIQEAGGTNAQQIEFIINVKYEDGRSIIKKINNTQIQDGKISLLV